MAKTPFQSRIIGEGTENPDQLLANPGNWRRHPKAQQDALEAMLRTVGWVQRVIVNKTTGHIVDGHLRVEVALRRNEPMVPVLYVSLTEAEEKVVLAAIDPIGGLAITDQEMLNDLLEGVQTGDDGLDVFLASLKQGPDSEATDPDEEWKGMPEFEQEDKTSEFSLIVHFASKRDAEAFAKLVKQSITDKTKSIWYPAQKRMDTESKRYGD